MLEELLNVIYLLFFNSIFMTLLGNFVNQHNATYHSYEKEDNKK